MLSTLIRLAKNPRLWQLALACYWVALFISTHVPIHRLALHRGSIDKWAHLGAFAGLAGIFAITWHVTCRRFNLRDAACVWGFIALYGAIEELTQPMVNRSASGIDWLADAGGAALGLVVFWILIRPRLQSLLDQSTDTTSSITEAEAFRPRRLAQFSLRTLFVLMTLTAVACYWLVLPTIYAQRFVVALSRNDYNTAESLFIPESDSFPGSFKDHDHFSARATIEPLTWRGLWNGERQVNVAIRYGDGGGIAGAGAEVYARRDGLKMGLLMP